MICSKSRLVFEHFTRKNLNSGYLLGVVMQRNVSHESFESNFRFHPLEFHDKFHPISIPKGSICIVMYSIFTNSYHQDQLYKFRIGHPTWINKPSIHPSIPKLTINQHGSSEKPIFCEKSQVEAGPLDYALPMQGR